MGARWSSEGAVVSSGGAVVEWGAQWSSGGCGGRVRGAVVE